MYKIKPKIHLFRQKIEHDYFWPQYILNKPFVFHFSFSIITTCQSWDVLLRYLAISNELVVSVHNQLGRNPRSRFSNIENRTTQPTQIYELWNELVNHYPTACANIIIGLAWQTVIRHIKLLPTSCKVMFLALTLRKAVLFALVSAATIKKLLWPIFLTQIKTVAIQIFTCKL